MFPACDYGDGGHLVSVAVVSRVDRVSMYSFFDCAPGWVEVRGRLTCCGKIPVACYRLLATGCTYDWAPD